MHLIVQELKAIYLLEMNKCLTGIFGKAYGLLKSGQRWVWT